MVLVRGLSIQKQGVSECYKVSFLAVYNDIVMKYSTKR